ncbi:hypothetical protein DVH24_004962 [Malus domestica]|uniref:Uncharacterized protein n=1 Tax=Malus domestica TaxID=3750 RepID=A0A498IBA8_MALDO|nr:hypothetical protein DVH24_004962 [Malus domestica]
MQRNFILFLGNMCCFQQAVGIREIVPTEVNTNKAYWTWGDDADVVIPKNLTLDTNDIGKLKMQFKELKVSFVWLAHEKEI